MEYKSKGYVFDEEVTAWLDKLKVAHGSYNKGLRLVMVIAAPGLALHRHCAAKVAGDPKRLIGGLGVEIVPTSGAGGPTGTTTVDPDERSATVNVHVHKFHQVEGQSALECACGATRNYERPSAKADDRGIPIPPVGKYSRRSLREKGDGKR